MMDVFLLIWFRLGRTKDSHIPPPAALRGRRSSRACGRSASRIAAKAKASQQQYPSITSWRVEVPQSDVHKCQSCPCRGRAAELILHVKQCSILFYWSAPLAHSAHTSPEPPGAAWDLRGPAWQIQAARTVSGLLLGEVSFTQRTVWNRNCNPVQTIKYF